MPATQMVEHLVGMQAQVPENPYVALWSRLVGFQPAELSDAIEQRRAVRGGLMRGTLHLTTDRDFLAIWPLIRPVLDRVLHGQSPFGRAMAGIDPAELMAAGRAWLDERPRTRAQLAPLMAERWPDHDGPCKRALGATACARGPSPLGRGEQPVELRVTRNVELRVSSRNGSTLPTEGRKLPSDHELADRSARSAASRRSTFAYPAWLNRLFHRDREAMGRVRKLWREHLGLTEEELRVVARTLAFSGRSRNRWRVCGIRSICSFGLPACGVFRRMKAPSSMMTLCFNGWRKAGWNSTGQDFVPPASARGIAGPGERAPIVYGVKSFQHATDRLEDRCTAVLDLVPAFHYWDCWSWIGATPSCAQRISSDAAKAHDCLRLILDAHLTLSIAAGSCSTSSRAGSSSWSSGRSAKRLVARRERARRQRLYWPSETKAVSSTGNGFAVAVSLDTRNGASGRSLCPCARSGGFNAADRAAICRARRAVRCVRPARLRPDGVADGEDQVRTGQGRRARSCPLVRCGTWRICVLLGPAAYGHRAGHPIRI